MLEGRTAVVTGAASGIGFGLAERFAQSGMKVVLADIEQAPLDEAADKLRASGAEVIAVRTDVSDGDAVDRLADAAFDAFGTVNLLCNNAGVGGGGPMTELTTNDWQWVIGVNLWGVIHGIRAFLPRMVKGGDDGHIVNTASMAGLTAGPMMGPYNATKFAVVAISETLHLESQIMHPSIGVSVLCPGWVNTRIGESGRNRPASLAGREQGITGDGPAQSIIGDLLKNGLAPARVAELVEDAVRTRRFYVLTHPEMIPAIETRMNNIISGTNPTLRVEGLFGAMANGED